MFGVGAMLEAYRNAAAKAQNSCSAEGWIAVECLAAEIHC